MSSKFKLQIRCVAERSCTRNNNVLGDKGVINYSSANTTSKLEQRWNRHFSQETHSFKGWVKHQTLSYACLWQFQRAATVWLILCSDVQPHHTQTDVEQSCFSFYTSGKFKAHFKRNSSPKNEHLLTMYSPSGHPRCRWVCFFMGIDLEKFSITSLAHQWIVCSEWVPSEWESKQLIKTLQ